MMAFEHHKEQLRDILLASLIDSLGYKDHISKGVPPVIVDTSTKALDSIWPQILELEEEAFTRGQLSMHPF